MKGTETADGHSAAKPQPLPLLHAMEERVGEMRRAIANCCQAVARFPAFLLAPGKSVFRIHCSPRRKIILKFFRYCPHISGLKWSGRRSLERNFHDGRITKPTGARRLKTRKASHEKFTTKQ